VASAQECEAALRTVADRLARAGSGLRNRVGENSVATRITDLELTFRASLRDGGLHDITELPADAPVPRRGDQDSFGRVDAVLSMASDDLIAMVDGRMSMLGAWTSGRVRIDANMLDLMRIRGFF